MAIHPLLEEAAKELSLPLEHLRGASELSGKLLRGAKDALCVRHPPTQDDDMDVAVFGSVARREATSVSDFDFVVVAHHVPRPGRVRITRDLLKGTQQVGEQLGLSNPGATGLFGKVLSAPDLTERIGLEQDSNTNHTRRILLLQESESVYVPRLHEELLRSILERYLFDYDPPKEGVPRFLLNDVVRYWRTLAVDYQAKRWEGFGSSWGLRYLKLIISRKLVYAGTLASVLLTKTATADYFVGQFRMPSLARLAQLLPRLDPKEKDALRIALEVADEFNGKLGDEAFREEAKSIEHRRDVKSGSDFERCIQRARDLQNALQVLFFESKVLKERSIKYLSF